MVDVLPVLCPFSCADASKVSFRAASRAVDTDDSSCASRLIVVVEQSLRVHAAQSARASRSRKTSYRQELRELRVYAVNVRVFASGALVRLRGAPSSVREGLPVTIEKTMLLSGRRGGYNGVSATVRSALVERCRMHRALGT